jgi:hypothetical protein
VYAWYQLQHVRTQWHNDEWFWAALCACVGAACDRLMLTSCFCEDSPYVHVKGAAHSNKTHKYASRSWANSSSIFIVCSKHNFVGSMSITCRCVSYAYTYSILFWQLQLLWINLLVIHCAMSVQIGSHVCYCSHVALYSHCAVTNCWALLFKTFGPVLLNVQRSRCVFSIVSGLINCSTTPLFVLSKTWTPIDN